MKLACILLVLVSIIGCDSKSEKLADTALKNKQYNKALVLYKQAIKEKPGREALYDKLTKVSSILTAKGLSLLQQKKYKECIEHLDPLTKGEFPVADARVLTVIAHIYGYPQNVQHLAIGVKMFEQLLRRSKEPIQIRSFSLQELEWLEKQDFKRSDLHGSHFEGTDISSIYRAFLYYHFIKNIASITTKDLFPIPASWGKKEQERLKKVYKIFTWFVHNIQIVKKSNPLYYPGLVPHVLLRGYGTLDEINTAFIFLTLQTRSPSYLFIPRRNGKTLSPRVLVNIGEKHWVLFDLLKGMPLLDKKGNLVNIEIGKKADLNSDLQSSDIDQGIIGVTLPPRSIIPRNSIFAQIFSSYKLSPPPFFYYGLRAVAKNAVRYAKIEKEDFFKTKKDKISVIYWPEYFKLWNQYQNQEKAKKLTNAKAIAINKQVRQMRLLEFNGFAKKSLDKYKEIKDKDKTEHTLFYEAVAHYNNKYVKTSSELFSSYLKKHANGFWTTTVHNYLALIALETGDKKKAREHYKKSNRLGVKIMDFYTK